MVEERISPNARRLPNPRRVAAFALVASVLLGLFAASLAAEAPVLRFEAPPELQSVVEQLEGVERSRLEGVIRLVGLDDPGPPIRVLLAPEGSLEAERVPDWVAGYAVGAIGLVVLMPSRSPAYPDRSLDAVLLHEVAHVLVARAAGRRGVPRWFNEGIAMAAGRYGLVDRFELVLATMRPGNPSLASLDRGFPVSPDASRRAYALSGAVVRWLQDTFGKRTPARILERVRAGDDFAFAFRDVTGVPIADAEVRFWRTTGNWRRFMPLLTSPTLGWFGITLLFLLAYAVRRRRNALQRAVWAAEDAAEEAAEAALDRQEAWQVEDTAAPTRKEWVN